MIKLREILRPEIADNARTRRYQSYLDESVARYVGGLRDDNTPLYKSGRRGQSPGAMAFCHFSPLSEHHGSDEIVELFSKSLGFWSDELLRDQCASLDEWSFTWDFEGFGYGYVWLESVLSEQLKSKTLGALSAVGQRFVDRAHRGQVGNQAVIGATGDLLLGYLLDNKDWIARANARFDDVGPKVLSDNGQVVEQYGPCHHYSYTAFCHAFHYVFLAQREEGFHDRIVRSLDWFRRAHTHSMYQITGASSRKFCARQADRTALFPALEYARSYQPMYEQLLDRMIEASDNKAAGYSCGPTPWQVLLNKTEHGEPSEEDRRIWDQPSTELYESVYYGRGPLKYALIHRKYQTGMAFTGWLPVMGLQTWAWGDEPPLISIAIDVPSGTQAWGVDTARFQASHLYYHHGPGCMAADVVWRPDGSSREGRPDEPAFVIWRHHNLFSIVIFTEVSTVMILTGPTGKRITRWTLHAQDPAEPDLQHPGVVSFRERTGRLYALRGEPTLTEELDADSGTTVRLLLYETAAKTSAFAFSNDTFEFRADHLEEAGMLTFADESGTYRADISTILDEDGRMAYGLSTAKIKRVEA